MHAAQPTYASRAVALTLAMVGISSPGAAPAAETDWWQAFRPEAVPNSTWWGTPFIGRGGDPLLGPVIGRDPLAWVDGGPAFGQAGATPADPLAAMGLHSDGKLRAGSTQYSVEWVEVTAKVTVPDPTVPEKDPLGKSTWQADHSLRVDMLGPLFVFGQVGANCTYAEAQQMKMTGRTGLGCKWKLWESSEVQLRGGPVVNYADPSQPVAPRDQTQLALEVTAKTGLIGPLKIEYVGSAIPALDPTGHDRLNQDLRLALPLGENSQFHVGTKYRWQDAAPTPWTERMQLYLGLSLTR